MRIGRLCISWRRPGRNFEIHGQQIDVRFDLFAKNQALEKSDPLHKTRSSLGLPPLREEK